MKDLRCTRRNCEHGRTEGKKEERGIDDRQSYLNNQLRNRVN